MSKNLNWVSAERVISKFVRDSGIEDFNETDIIEQIGEALEQIGTINLYEKKVEILEVKNHQVLMPCGLSSIIQIVQDRVASAHAVMPALYDKYQGNIEPLLDTSNIFDCSTLLLPEEQDYYRPYFDLRAEYEGKASYNGDDSYGSYYWNKYIPVRLSNHTFFDSIVMQEEPELYNKYKHMAPEYTIVHNTLKFSFKEGSIVIAYNRPVIDEKTGYPLVPDNVSVLTAINAYLMMKYAMRLWFLGREGYADKMQKMEQDWHWYCKQAGNTMIMPYGEDEFENIRQGRKTMIPRNHYYGYFGNLGKDTTVGWSKGIGQGGLGIGRYGNSNYR